MTKEFERSSLQDIPLLRVLTDRGTEYCGKVEHLLDTG